MALNRREMIWISSGTVVWTALGSIPSFASKASDLINELTSGANLGEGLIDLSHV